MYLCFSIAILSSSTLWLLSPQSCAFCFWLATYDGHNFEVMATSSSEGPCAVATTFTCVTQNVAALCDASEAIRAVLASAQDDDYAYLPKGRQASLSYLNIALKIPP